VQKCLILLVLFSSAALAKKPTPMIKKSELPACYSTDLEKVKLHLTDEESPLQFEYVAPKQKWDDYGESKLQGHYKKLHVNKHPEGHGAEVTQLGIRTKYWDKEGRERYYYRVKKKLKIKEGHYQFHSSHTSFIGGNRFSSSGTFSNGKYRFHLGYNIKDTRKIPKYRIREMLLNMGGMQPFHGVACVFANEIFAHPSRIQKETKYFGQKVHDLSTLPLYDPSDLVRATNLPIEYHDCPDQVNLNDALPDLDKSVTDLYQHLVLKELIDGSKSTPEIQSAIEKNLPYKLAQYMATPREITKKDYLELLNIWPSISKEMRKLIRKNILLDKDIQLAIEKEFFNRISPKQLTPYLKMGYRMPNNLTNFEYTPEGMEAFSKKQYLEQKELLNSFFWGAKDNQTLKKFGEILKEKELTIQSPRSFSHIIMMGDRTPALPQFIQDNVITSTKDLNDALFFRQNDELIQAIINKLSFRENEIHGVYYKRLKQKYDLSRFKNVP
jgi:hypothetical protein